MTYDAVIVGGGPAGATSAADLAAAGHKVLLLDRAGRIKPCGGAVPPRLLEDFAIPESMLVARARAARMISPAARNVDMPVGDGYVGMVDRDTFDEWLRVRAEEQGAERRTGTFEAVERDADGTAIVRYRCERGGEPTRVRTRSVVGADGARSAVARQALGETKVRCVYAYHEIIRAPKHGTGDYEDSRCDVFYQGDLSPDFYAWIFPHGDTASVGVGSADKGFALRDAVKRMRSRNGLADCETLRSEGAPIPLKPLKRWDNRRDVIVTGDAAGVVAPASGEGIYYAMTSARFVAQSVDRFLVTGEPRHLASARKSFMREHGRTFWVLGIMQHFWYKNDARRERFVKICADPDVQELTWQAYMNKRLVRARPGAHLRIFFKDTAHLLGLVPVAR